MDKGPQRFRSVEESRASLENEVSESDAIMQQWSEGLLSRTIFVK